MVGCVGDLRGKPCRQGQGGLQKPLEESSAQLVMRSSPRHTAAHCYLLRPVSFPLTHTQAHAVLMLILFRSKGGASGPFVLSLQTFLSQFCRKG